MKSVFLDTGYIIALEAKDDQHHQVALKHWQSLLKSLPRLVMTSYVFDEIVSFFNSRNQHAKAVEVGRRLISSPTIDFIHVDEYLFFEGWHYFEQHADKLYSLTDCISFVVMERLKIRKALAFDRHFVQAGFEKLP
jgi:predicted nucleic acid-binding protein